MHKQRWITALVAIPFLVFLIFQKPVVFTCLIAAVSVIGLWEYYRIAFHDVENPSMGPAQIIGCLAAPLIVFAVHFKSVGAVAVLLAGNILIVGAAAVMNYKKDPLFLNSVAKQTLGLIYIPVFLSHLVLIQASESGIAWIFLLLILAFTNDTGAYYTGRRFGRHKLHPSVSPGKTIEGAAGGLLICVAVGSLFKAIFLPAAPWGWSIVFFICAGVAGPMGDLFESAMKRAAHIKDSGTILPGHGGLLDRIDALLFVAPTAYFFKNFVL